MVYKIRWTKTGIRKANINADYIKKCYSEKRLIDYYNRIKSLIDILKILPDFGEKSRNQKTLRSVLINEDYRMSYSIKNDTIYIVNIVVVRSKSNRLK
jgi:plasmid maintenance system killer protein